MPELYTSRQHLVQLMRGFSGTTYDQRANYLNVLISSIGGYIIAEDAGKNLTMLCIQMNVGLQLLAGMGHFRNHKRKGVLALTTVKLLVFYAPFEGLKKDKDSNQESIKWLITERWIGWLIMV